MIKKFASDVVVALFVCITAFSQETNLNRHDFMYAGQSKNPRMFIGHKNLGGKTLLYLIDGTYGSRDVNGSHHQSGRRLRSTTSGHALSLHPRILSPLMPWQWTCLSASGRSSAASVSAMSICLRLPRYLIQTPVQPTIRSLTERLSLPLSASLSIATRTANTRRLT